MTVLGWEGVDGIHYGRIRGYGDMVFAVNPMLPESSMSAPWQAASGTFCACSGLRLHYHFGAGRRLDAGAVRHLSPRPLENAVTPDAQAVLERIAAAFRLTPMEDPFSYIKGVQAASFDGGKLHYTDEYYDTLGLARPDRREPASQGFEFETVVFALEKE